MHLSFNYIFSFHKLCKIFKRVCLVIGYDCKVKDIVSLCPSSAT